VVVEEHEARRLSRDVAVREFEDTRKRIHDGQETPSALSSKRSEVASYDKELAQAEVQIDQAANSLKRLLAPSVFDPIWGIGLIATDRPEAPDRSPGISADKRTSASLDEAVKIALARRPELEQLRLQAQQSDAEVRFAQREAKPAVNLRLEV
jgi:outer membrane protein TolC